MRPVTVDAPASGNSPIVPLDINQVGPVTIQLTILTGAASLTVQYTMDDPYSSVAPTNWFPAGAPLATAVAAAAGALVDSAGHLIVPRALRLNNSVAASTGRMTVAQAGVQG